MNHVSWEYLLKSECTKWRELLVNSTLDLGSLVPALNIISDNINSAVFAMSYEI